MFSPPQHKTGDLVNNKTKFRSELSTRDVLTFSRGASLNIDESPHDGLIIINKGLESVEGIWQKPLQPGVYKNMGCAALLLLMINMVISRLSLQMNGSTHQVRIYISAYPGEALSCSAK